MSHFNGSAMTQNGNAQVEELDEIPFYLRETVQRIIDKRVHKRVNAEMNELKVYVRE